MKSTKISVHPRTILLLSSLQYRQMKYMIARPIDKTTETFKCWGELRKAKKSADVNNLKCVCGKGDFDFGLVGHACIANEDRGAVGDFHVALGQLCQAWMITPELLHPGYGMR